MRRFSSSITDHSLDAGGIDPAVRPCELQEEVKAVLARTGVSLDFAFFVYNQRDRMALARKACKDSKA